MNKIILAAVALATFGTAGAATAANLSTPEQRGQTIIAPAPEAAPVVVEGRNVTVTAPSTSGVEPYIARAIEQDARGNK